MAMNGTRLDAGRRRSPSKSPSPLAGEGRGEGAVQDEAPRRAQSSILNRPLIRPTADAAGHLLPRGEKGRAPFLSASGVPAAFFWINLAQRQDRLS
jgi:hypothetical protein